MPKRCRSPLLLHAINLFTPDMLSCSELDVNKTIRTLDPRHRTSRPDALFIRHVDHLPHRKFALAVVRRGASAFGEARHCPRREEILLVARVWPLMMLSFVKAPDLRGGEPPARRGTTPCTVGGTIGTPGTGSSPRRICGFRPVFSVLPRHVCRRLLTRSRAQTAPKHPRRTLANLCHVPETDADPGCELPRIYPASVWF